jgi:ubiquinone/menaquinone biosynthesis C-methylase UbiE
MTDKTARKWPKQFPALNAEQMAISDDFMKYWHEVLPKRFGVVDAFNHGYPAKTARRNFIRCLEIGAGLGEHLEFETLTAEQAANYYAVDIRPNMIEELRKRHPEVNAFVGDCQQRLDFPDGYFDRILAIHVLEHLPDLPAAVREIFRLCDNASGMVQVLLPCEGSPAYTLARRISAQRIFEKRYKQSYKWFIEREHINVPNEIIDELAQYFEIERRSYFPIPIPQLWCNLVVALNLRPKAQHPEADGSQQSIGARRRQ